MAREGLRLGEASALRWADLDLTRGVLRLDANRTDEPRAWALGPDVVRGLSARHRDCEPRPEDLVFAADEVPLAQDGLTEVSRADLQTAGIERPELFERSAKRRPIRAHDLRVSFATLALATGKTEAWVADRTGHRSSQMINRYRRAARTAGELGLSWFAPQDATLALAPRPQGGPR